MRRHETEGGPGRWQQGLFRILFEPQAVSGRVFELVLLVAILASIATVMLESVEGFRAGHGVLLRRLEWGFTALFTAEYALRLLCLKRPLRYAVSFFGIVDFLAVVPTYLALLAGGAHVFLVVRVIRMLRVFRLLKLGRYLQAGDTIWLALRASRQKIAVFLTGVLSLVVLIGTLMYLIEGPETGFTSIPASIYWAIVTLTTVGYGDIAPQTIAGQALASLVMIMGYSILAVPTGIVTVEMGKMSRMEAGAGRECAACGAQGHAVDAAFCRRCGVRL